jgi:hypothetical protein
MTPCSGISSPAFDYIVMRRHPLNDCQSYQYVHPTTGHVVTGLSGVGVGSLNFHLVFLPAACFLSGKAGAALSVESVLSVRLEDIEAAIWKDRDKSHSTVLFKMNCEAEGIVSNPYFPDFLGSPKYQIGGRKIYSASTASSETQEKIVPLSFYGQATLVRKGTEWTIEELKIDRSMPSMEDYFELMEARPKPVGGEK